MIIEDGTGKGYLASVSSENKLRVTAVTASQEHFANHNQGRGYSLIFEATPVSGGCFLYMENTDLERDLSIEGFWFKMEAEDFFTIKLGDKGTPANGTSITPVNLNTASGFGAQGIFQNGNNITGLSGGSVIYKFYHAPDVNKASVYRNFNQDVIISRNGTLTMYANSGSTFISGIMIFNFHGTHN